LVDQIKATVNKGASGQVQFAYHSLTDKHLKALKLGPQRQQAVALHNNPLRAAKIMANDFQYKIDQIYLPKKTLQQKQAANLQQKINEFIMMLEENNIARALKQIEKLKQYIDKNISNQKLVPNGQNQLNRIKRILQYQ